jgi:ferredoxin-NADP reductase
MATLGANSDIGEIEMAGASPQTPGQSSGPTPPIPPQPRRIAWRFANIVDIIDETPNTKSLVLHVPDWPGHLPGQHVDIRLTADDGYQAQRSYSIASPPEQPEVVLTVERLEDGEVSPYLTEALRPGDPLEVRGPIGGYFTWTVADGGPLFLVAGGSGIVPLMAMLRHRAIARSKVPATLLYSSRTYEQVIYQAELETLAAQGDGLQVIQTLTRSAPPAWTGHRQRIDRALLAQVAPAPAAQPHIFICGPTALVEAVATAMVDLGHDPARVKTERFGPTGG